MKVTLAQIPHLANRVAIELARSGLVTMTQGMDPIVAEAKKILEESVKQEAALEARVKEIVNDNEDEIDFYQADDRQLFFMIKKKLAPEYGVILSYEDRFSDLAHKILDAIYEEDLMNYDVSENRLKNIIYDAITSFIADNDEIERAVNEKMKSFQKQLIPGTDEYELRFEKLYREELTRRGLA
ncbi:DUF507 family protein [Sulfurimonas sp. HSL-3221]|uniref:DUF507 family protein n=1 Tax=Sulfurimonadaceae TaxID=2771471 RepID=UPI001E607F65|nr:DUF507 family protein [Sulfurimonas sp. HSL-3221]UFS62702.1 DUF507 family protein [Sulfurimonas sp. HSL-3221]